VRAHHVNSISPNGAGGSGTFSEAGYTR
jgi:hypothetical protein